MVSFFEAKALLKFFGYFSRCICLSAIAYFTTTSVYASDNTTRLEFENLNVSHGLSHNNVNCIVQDQKGIMWFGTDNGLNRFDGNEIKIYKNSPNDSNSLGNNNIRCLMVDHSGKIWAGTKGGGVSIYDYEIQGFTHLVFDQDNPNSLSYNEVLSIFEDSDHEIWIGTEKGLNRLNNNLTHINRYFSDPGNVHSLSSNTILAIAQDMSGYIWFGCWEGGICRFDKQTGLFERFLPNFPDDSEINTNRMNIWSIHEDRNGMIWFGTYRGGLMSYDPIKNVFRSYVKSDDSNSLGHNIVRTIFEDSHSNLWIGTEGGGLNLLNREKNTFFRYVPDKDSPFSLSSDKIWSVFEDERKILWVGNFEGGVNYFNQYKHRFSHIHNSRYPELLSNNILSITIDSDGDIWIGTEKGLCRFKPNSNILENFSETSVKYPLQNIIVRCLTEDRKGNIWVGLYDRGGLYKINKKTLDVELFYPDDNDTNSLTNTNISCIYEDWKGNLWIGTQDGLNMYLPEKNHFRTYLNDPNIITSIGPGDINDIVMDRSGYLWIGLEGGGLSRMNIAKGRFRQFRALQNRPNSLASNYINCISEDVNGNLLIGTSVGLNLYIAEKDSFYLYNDRNGLPFNEIYDIIVDNATWWISSDEGLISYNTRNRVVKIYNKNDGLQDDIFNVGAFTKNAEGELFIGGLNGLNIFHPDSLVENKNQIKTYIKKLYLFNREVSMYDENSPLEKPISEMEELVLDYDQSVITFEYSGICYTNPEEVKYAYMLSGFDDQWNYVSHKKTATYTNLDPGEYTFQVKACNSDNIWAEIPTSLQLVIIPPYWQTWWFRIIIILFSLGLIFSGYYLRLSRIRHQKNALEKEVAERTYEIREQNLILQKQGEEIKQQAEVIERMNSILKIRNEKLEHDVEDRTKARVMQKTVTFQEFKEIYPNDEACLKYLDEIKWKEGFKCKKCGSDKYKYTHLSKNNIPYSRRCLSCKNIESPMVDTIFYRIKFPVVKAFYILFLVSSGKQITVDEMADILDLRRQTCWTFQKKVKEVMNQKKSRKYNEWSYLILHKK